MMDIYVKMEIITNRVHHFNYIVELPNRGKFLCWKFGNIEVMTRMSNKLDLEFWTSLYEIVELLNRGKFLCCKGYSFY